MSGSVNLTELYEVRGLSIPQIAVTTGVPRSTVRCRLVALGVRLRSATEGVRLRSQDLSAARKGKKRAPFSALHRERIADARRRAPAAGLSLKPSGYIEITRGPDKGRGLHVVRMERLIGRRLAANEIVHHIDEDRFNAALSNLALMTRDDHTRLHRHLEKIRSEQCQAA